MTPAILRERKTGSEGSSDLTDVLDLERGLSPTLGKLAGLELPISIGKHRSP